MDEGRGAGRDRRRAVRTFGISLVVVLAAGSVVASGPGGARAGYGPGGPGGGGYNTPTPTKTAVPTVTVTPPPPDKTAPRCSAKPARKQTARKIRRRGLALTLKCDEDARYATRLFVSRQQARKLGIKRKAKRRVLVGKRTAFLKDNVARHVRIKLNKKARKGISRMKRHGIRKLKLTIATSAQDVAKNVRRTSTSRSFKR